jgi:predicted PurR-regulated permease PerM
MNKNRPTLIFLVVLSILALALCILLFSPFLKPVLSAIVIAVVLYPVHARIHRIVRSPSLAALISTTLIIVIIIVPAVLIVAAVTHEVGELYVFLGQKSSESGGFGQYLMQLLNRPIQWVSRYVDTSQFDAQTALFSKLQQWSSFLLQEVGILAGNVGSLLFNMVLAFFTLFFLLREGRSIRRRISAILPLTSEQAERLFTGIENTIVATVYGGLVVAAVQGTLVGLALWVLGVPSPVLWGVIAAVFALIPLVGTAAVWVPAAIYLFAYGSWVKALIMIAWGAGIVGTVDNILRPYLISGRVQIHTLLIFFAVLGGVNVFGFIGLFVGPVIIAVTMTLFSMLRDEARAWKSNDQAIK